MAERRARQAVPRFPHCDRAEETLRQIFRVFQLPDPAVRRALFAALLVENSVTLLSGAWGVGKTQLVRLIRKAVFSDGHGGFLFDAETCHQDLTAFDALYHLDLAALQNGREVVHPKAMVTARFKFFNEIQRAGTAFFNALLPLFAERRITYRDHEFDVPAFVCFMDRNPHDAGSSEVPEAFLDRIDFGFEIPAIHLSGIMDLQRIRRVQDGYHWGDLEDLVEPVMEFSQLLDIWEDVKRIEIPERIEHFCAMLTETLRLCIVTERSTARVDFDLECETCQFHGEICSHILKVPGQRIGNSTLRLSQALAWLDREEQVREAHVLAAFPWCVAHRLHIRPEELRRSPSAMTWVREVALGEIITPRLPRWSQALDALEPPDADTLASLGENDLAVRALHLAVLDRAGEPVERGGGK